MFNPLYFVRIWDRKYCRHEQSGARQRADHCLRLHGRATVSAISFNMVALKLLPCHTELEQSGGIAEV